MQPKSRNCDLFHVNQVKTCLQGLLITTNYETFANDYPCGFRGFLPFRATGMRGQYVLGTFIPGSWPEEVSFQLSNSAGDVVFEYQADGNDALTFELCLPSDCYTLELFDAFGDGWNGAVLSFELFGLPVEVTLEDGDYQSFVFPIGPDVFCGDPVVYGCTDPLAINFDPNATADDGSCEYSDECDQNEVTIQMYVIDNQWLAIMNFTDQFGNVLFSGTIWEDNYTTTFCLPPGCYGVEVLSVGAGNTGLPLLDIYVDGALVQTVFDTEGDPTQYYFGIETEDCEEYVFGCTDPEAINFDPNANVDDGSCEYTGDIEGCTDPNALNYNPWANIDDGSCEYPCEEGQVTANLYVCTFANGGNVGLTIINSETGDVVYDQQGYNNNEIMNTTICLDPEGCYTVIMTNNGGDTGWYNGYWWINVDGVQIVTEFLDDDLQEEVIDFCSDDIPVYGCTDPEAENYDPEANTDDGSCYYPVDCGDLNALTLIVEPGAFPGEMSYVISYQETGEIIFQGGGFIDLPVITVCVPDGCYNITMFDSFGDGWNGGSVMASIDGTIIGAYTLEEGEIGIDVINVNMDGCDDPILEIYGCTDEGAINYNPNATIDDGSCEYGPDNDLCVDAFPILGTYTDGTNIGAYLNEGPGGDCWGFGNGEAEQTSVWYSFVTPEEPAEIHIEALYSDLSPSMTDTQFGLYAECGGEMIYCDGNSGEGLMSAFNFACGDLEPNTTYYLLVDGYGSQQGNFVLEYVVSECGTNVFGCTDPNAINYNPDATIDDGTCEYEQIIFGCTDPAAINYNPLATIDDGTCQYIIDSCDANYVEVFLTPGGFPTEISWVLTSEDGVVVGEGVGGNGNGNGVFQLLCLEDGCYNLEMFDSFGDGWNGAVIYFNDQSFTLDEGDYGTGVVNINSECEVEDILGCTDPAAINYNPLATVDDGSCEYIVDSCDGVWSYWGFEGDFQCPVTWTLTSTSGDIVSQGSILDGFYSEEFCAEDDCYVLDILVEPNEEGELAFLFVFFNDQYFEIMEQGFYSITFCVDPVDVYGCTDPEAINYNPQATVDDGSCEYQQDILGCTDPAALNYNPLATIDDGSCEYIIDSCDANLITFIYAEGAFTSESSWSLSDENGNVVADADYSFDPLAQSVCLEDGCYTLELFDSFGDGWNGGVLFSPELGVEFVLEEGNYAVNTLSVNAECGEIIAGCTDPEALNYNPEATVDDGSCEYEQEIFGCTDPAAINFNPLANIDDGSCIYVEDSCETNTVTLAFNPGGWLEEVSWYLTDGAGNVLADADYSIDDALVQTLCLEDGCYTLEMYDSFGDGWNGGVLEVISANSIESITLPTGDYASYSFGINEEGCGGFNEVFGCTDPEALNWNPAATADDGSCIYDPWNADCTAEFFWFQDPQNPANILVINLSAAFAGYSHTWDFGDGTIVENTPFPSHVYAAAGEYEICLTVYGENCEDTYCATIYFEDLGPNGVQTEYTINIIDADEASEVLSVDDQDVMVDLVGYPNPTADDFNISITTSVNENLTIEVYDLTGKAIITERFTTSNGTSLFTLPTRTLSSGMYIVKLQGESIQQSMTFEKM